MVEYKSRSFPFDKLRVRMTIVKYKSRSFAALRMTIHMIVEAKGLLFDMDGVLVSSIGAVERC